ncbi:MAG TPA: hypothetical protein VJ799_04215 [Nitrososphaeraceae archaeon]|nr:hypothetical protein [Nitrososphaeraceae archaeon]
MNKYIATVAAVFLMVATAVSANTMLSYAQNASNMTGDVGSDMTGDVGSDMTGDVGSDMTGDVGSDMTGDISKLAPDGSATGLVAQGEKAFIVVCPEDFLTIKQCQILVTQPTVVAVK